MFQFLEFDNLNDGEIKLVLKSQDQPDNEGATPITINDVPDIEVLQYHDNEKIDMYVWTIRECER